MRFGGSWWLDACNYRADIDQFNLCLAEPDNTPTDSHPKYIALGIIGGWSGAPLVLRKSVIMTIYAKGT